MESANYIPLGDVEKRAAFDGPAVFKEKIIGQTKEDRKAIARQVRLQAKRAKKLVKADAKRQRKQNAIDNRRATRNPEKYVKNKDRNKRREIDLERQKIRYDAVRQAERLAAIHDKSGKMFNVGEVVVLENGVVKSKEAMRRAEEVKAAKAAAAGLELNGGVVDAKPVQIGDAKSVQVGEGVNPSRVALIQGNGKGLPGAPKPKKISNKQKKRQEELRPKPVPPKPILPEGISLPENEENLIELWDITDEGIVRRLSNKKSEKRSAAKQLRRAQAEKKKLNRAMKALKKEAGNKGILWDPEAARKEVLGMGTYLPTSKPSASDSESDSSSSSDDESDSESWETDDEDKPKKSKKEKKDAGTTKMKNPKHPRINLTLLKAAEEKEASLKAEKLKRKIQRREDAKKAAIKADEAAKKKAAEDAANGVVVEVKEEKSSKKRKRSKDEVDVPEQIVENGEAEEIAENGEGAKEDEESKKKKQKVVRSNDSKLDKLIALEEQKRKQAAGSDAEEEPKVEEKSKKEKREKKEKKEKKLEFATEDVEAATPIAIEGASVKTKKPKKEKKVKKDKKDKKDKKTKKEKRAEKEALLPEEEQLAYEELATNGAEQWNPDALNGDESRKDKFLRLLGAKKGGVQDEADGVKEKKNGKGKEDIDKVQGELERQFELGMKKKHDGGGKRRGLGS